MSEPLAYFLAWTCYGTWLHGDERGSVDDVHNVPGSAYPAQDAARTARERQRMKYREVTLEAAARRVVRDVIVKHCDIRD